MKRTAAVMMLLLGLLIVADSAYASPGLNKIAVAHGLADNQYMACYANESEDLKCRLVTSAGEVTGSELTVSWNTCINPAIAYDSDLDMFLVVWVEYSSPNWAMKARLVTPECQLSGSEITLLNSSDNDMTPQVVYSSNSQRYLVAYSLGTSIAVQFMNGDASLDGSELTVIDGSAISYSRVETPALAFDSVNNRFLIAGLASFGTPDFSQYGVIVDDEESPSVYAGPFSIVGHAQWLYQPALAFDAVNERFLAIWEVYTGSGHELWGQLVNTDGSLYGTNWKINDDREVYFANDVVYKTVDDRYLVVWRNYDLYANAEDLHAQEVSSTGGNYGDEFLLVSPAYSYPLDLAYNTLMDNTLVAYRNTVSFITPGFLVTPEVPEADLSVEITGQDTALLGDSLTYTVTVTNEGDDNATGVVLTVAVPDSLSFIQEVLSQGSCDYDNATLTCDLDYLENGEDATVDLEFIAVEVGSISISATVTSEVLDTDTSNNADAQETLIRQNFTLSQSEGTIGTEIEITGEGFGTKKGKVYLVGPDKPVSLKVLSWNEGGSDVIRALVKKAPPVGMYDVSVLPKEPKGVEAIIEQDAFAIKAPEITGSPASGYAGQTRTITGGFFGTKKGKVYIEYTDDKGKLKRKSCKVLSWPLDSDTGTGNGEIQFVVPKKLPLDDWTLIVQNKVDEDSVTFEITDEK